MHSLAVEPLANFIETEKTGINSERGMKKASHSHEHLSPKSVKLHFSLDCFIPMRKVQLFGEFLSN